MTIPIAPIAGILGAPGVGYAINAIIAGNVTEALNNVKSLVGVGSNGQFDMQLLKINMSPVIAGALVHWGASKIGINRTLAAAKIPLIRI